MQFKQKTRETIFVHFMHNFSGYDSHLILPVLSKKLLPEIETISVIPKYIEKFMAIKINQRITFLDSLKKEFYNSITRSHITEEKYKLAEEIWEVFDMKCMKDYMEIYCMCDTLLRQRFSKLLDRTRLITSK